jgi:hypothetical protein
MTGTPTAWTHGRRPGLPGKALMLYAVDVDAADVARFSSWYTHEHLPERVGVPGFLRGRRYVRSAGPGREHLTLYDARDTGVFSSAEYLARLDDPTPLTRSVVATFRRPHRAVLSVVFSHGAATGSRLAVVHLPGDPTGELHRWVEESLAPSVLRDPDVCGLHLGAVDVTATGAKSGTVEGRGTAEKLDAACVLLVDGLTTVGDVARRAAAECHARGLVPQPPEPSTYDVVVSLLPA